MSNKKRIDDLEKKIGYIESKQDEFQNYISKLRKELHEIKGIEDTANLIEDLEQEKIVRPFAPDPVSNEVKSSPSPIQKRVKTQNPIEKFLDNVEIKSNLENFIGTNLINKIGILILIFGVIIGSKYAIDNDLISPLARIIIGYLISFGLLAFALKLKAKYLNFSAVLLSGSLTLLYFLSFIAYDFYSFIPQTAAFGLMFLFTIFAVISSLNYNKQVIALIGLVGSYAIPFLLSNNSGNFIFLFSYMAIVNIGILVISFRKDWKVLYYSAFAFTWLIFTAWLFNDYSASDLLPALGFATLYYVIFYIAFIAYKIIKKEDFAKIDVVFVLLNSFIYFGIGYYILDYKETSRSYLGIFAVANAIVHFLVSRMFFKNENADDKLFYLAIGLVFVFITIAIPVQLDGNWVTLLWVLEAGLLFWLGRTKNISIYEKISYPIILLSFFSLYDDWGSFSYKYKEAKAFLNPVFMTALIASVVYGFINYINIKNEAIDRVKNKFYSVLKFALPIIFIMTLFVTFSNEIGHLFDNAFERSRLKLFDSDLHGLYNYDIYDFKDLSILFYSVTFLLGITLFNFKKLKNTLLTKITFGASLLLLFFSLSAGLFICSELRTSYLLQETEEFYNKGIMHLAIRYINFAFIALLVYSIWLHIKQNIIPESFSKHFNVLIHLVVLWFLSSELLHWLDIFGNKNAYKLALTILWGSYSLLMVVLGLWKDKKNTRIAAIGLFAITLVKLFFYDITNLSTIYKTIVLIILGVLLLIISFLYNKYSKNETNEIEK